MEKIVNSKINEEYIKVKHPSGLTILLAPMKGYSSTFALFATKYGSVDTTFKTAAEKDFVCVPEGIAHFLEHKLFENEDCDVFSLYAKYGANANAFTSFDKTAYLFSCTDYVKENLEILLDFVQKPYFTKETVDKEQGIIGQEIRMYDDDPNWRVFFNCLTSLYHNNPVRIDIAGTTDTIAKIDADLLYKCYYTFYNLHNMVLSIAGNFDVDEVLALCDKMLKPCDAIGLETTIEDEPYEVVKKENVQKMSVSIPLFNIAFKADYKDGFEGTKDYVYCTTLLSMIAGKTSKGYKEMYESGLINSAFSAESFYGRGFFAPMFSGESKKPREVFEKIKQLISDAKANGLDKEQFEIIKKQNYGELLSGFNSVRVVAQNMMEAHFSDISAFDMIDISAQMTFEDVTAFLDKIDIENGTISIIEPIE